MTETRRPAWLLIVTLPIFITDLREPSKVGGVWSYGSWRADSVSGVLDGLRRVCTLAIA